MRIRARLAAIGLLTTASIAHAQTQTADGVDALLRGEYQRAAEILKPIAERSPRPDHVAEFFMGMLYDNGQGVEADAIRACAMYVRASSESTSPFGVQASALVRLFRGSHSREAFEDCTLLASIGFDHRFQPVTFTLEPDHWIAWDAGGYTISYKGTSRRSQGIFGRNGPVYLPLQHAVLSVGPLRSIRRHFIEMFTWTPNNDRQAWTLEWTLFEVVRDNLMAVTSQQLETIPGQQPPSSTSFDARQLVSLRVNDGGDPEWAVLSTANPRSAVIPSEADRLAQRERERARSEAEARGGLEPRGGHPPHSQLELCRRGRLWPRVCLRFVRGPNRNYHCQRRQGPASAFDVATDVRSGHTTERPRGDCSRLRTAGAPRILQ
jgi:hypothetical protein